jgi:hypothetical protein
VPDAAEFVDDIIDVIDVILVDFFNDDMIELFDYIDSAMLNQNKDFHGRFVVTKIHNTHFDYLDVLQQFVRRNYNTMRDLINDIYTRETPD